MAACFDPTHQPIPENPAKLQGPEVGDVVTYHDPRYPRWDGVVMTVEARSYVWSPEQHRPDGFHGYRRYDWTVVCWERDNDGRPGSMVVDDDKLEAVA